MKRLCQKDLWIPNSVSNGVMLLFPSKRQLRERRLVPWCIFNVNEVLVIWDAVVFWQLKQTNEGLEQRSPEQKDENVRTQDMTVLNN